MENGFSFELYEMVFENCFVHSSRYENGNLQLSLFGTDPETQETAHFANITLEHNKILREDLGILKKQVGICVKDAMIYPIYTINLSKVIEKQYCMHELVAA